MGGDTEEEAEEEAEGLVGEGTTKATVLTNKAMVVTNTVVGIWGRRVEEEEEEKRVTQPTPTTLAEAEERQRGEQEVGGEEGEEVPETDALRGTAAASTLPEQWHQRHRPVLFHLLFYLLFYLL